MLAGVKHVKFLGGYILEDLEVCYVSKQTRVWSSST